jgi:hypothetical protein
MRVFWDIAPCSLAEVDPHFRVCTISIIRVASGGSTQHRNASLLKRDYTALYPRKLSSSYSPEISQSEYEVNELVTKRVTVWVKTNKLPSEWMDEWQRE